MNKALEAHNITLEEAEKEEGKKPWWDKYAFPNPGAYEAWEIYCLAEIQRAHPYEREERWKEMFEEFAQCMSPSQLYLFNGKQTLI